MGQKIIMHLPLLTYYYVSILCYPAVFILALSFVKGQHIFHSQVFLRQFWQILYVCVCMSFNLSHFPSVFTF